MEKLKTTSKCWDEAVTLVVSPGFDFTRKKLCFFIHSISFKMNGLFERHAVTGIIYSYLMHNLRNLREGQKPRNHMRVNLIFNFYFRLFFRHWLLLPFLCIVLPSLFCFCFVQRWFDCIALLNYSGEYTLCKHSVELGYRREWLIPQGHTCVRELVEGFKSKPTRASRWCSNIHLGCATCLEIIEQISTSTWGYSNQD